MSSVRASGSIQEAARQRETVAHARSIGAARKTGSLVRSLSEVRAKPKAKEQEVLDVAAEYFLRHGYEGASINAMARSSGISKESIYRYFSSKKQLFEAVVARELIEYRDTLRRLDSALKTMDLRAALITVAETILGIITTDRTLALRRLIFDEATRSPDIGQHYYEIGPGQAYTALEHAFEAHQVSGVFDAAALSRHFMALMSWRIMIERECAVVAAPSKADITRLAESAADDFIKAFLCAR
jgi:AcrR family transcriptional regulator